MTVLRLQHFLIATSLLCISSAALAQYAWVDENGHKQYSDMPPPTSAHVKNVRTLQGDFSGASDDDNKGASKATDKTTPTLAEQDAAFRKRQDELAEKNKKADADAKLAQDKAQNCAHAQAYQRSLDSGIRLVQTDANGQRSFLDDNQRAQASRDNQQILSECKG
ncbi:DUF4124 domain-containing protein [Glaciimonas soli]|uniref:DUF4124 domain-containing protein n=1 Tax=Glaciimonas soli TaxID=2590999 RepID=A0A843YV50_9BURK|nr:DUF4124 domain-containing protein [Glaciimonas soli]MQR01553.1 DUF4124 domain-containing protein [Glaciimonas soli]